MKKNSNLSLAELENKFALSINEAVRYFGIGDKNLRKLIQDNKNAEWFFMVGNCYRINRPLFERYLRTVRKI